MNKITLFRIINILLIFFSSLPLFAQQDYEGYILCIDNTNAGIQQANQYYYIPLDYKKNKDSEIKTLNYNNFKLTAKIITLGGLNFYKDVFDFEGETCINKRNTELNFYFNTNKKLVYFHYYENNGTPKINKTYFLDKIKRDKFYLAKIKFKGCKLINKNYLKSKIVEMYAYEVEKIEPTSIFEQKEIIELIKEAYCEK